MQFFPLIRHILFVSGLMAIASTDLANAEDSWRDLYRPQVRDGMPCRVMTPLSFAPNTNYPVIVSLHGAGGKGTDNKKQLKDWNRQLAEKQIRMDFPCYVVAPQADQLWNSEHLRKIQIGADVLRRPGPPAPNA